MWKGGKIMGGRGASSKIPTAHPGGGGGGGNASFTGGVGAPITTLKAGLGSAIVIAERGEFNGKTYPLINIKAAIVDGEKIKADTWYELRNGEFREVKVW